MGVTRRLSIFAADVVPGGAKGTRTPDPLLAKEVAAAGRPAAAQAKNSTAYSVIDRESPWMTALTGTWRARTRLMAGSHDHLIRSSGQAVQDRPGASPLWADVPGSSRRDRRRLASWQQPNTLLPRHCLSLGSVGHTAAVYCSRLPASQQRCTSYCESLSKLEPQLGVACRSVSMSKIERAYKLGQVFTPSAPVARR